MTVIGESNVIMKEFNQEIGLRSENFRKHNKSSTLSTITKLMMYCLGIWCFNITEEQEWTERTYGGIRN
jgi:hypothetical protein